MSTSPKPPRRSLLKNIQCPSREKLGTLSDAAVLTIGPRFTGGPHGSSTLAR
ncbi:MAG TPA: hypothetical protein VKM94_05915 [Blastocatellia bacterium]|nr:hypothetical protein [Blastocatellia bacterium]